MKSILVLLLLACTLTVHAATPAELMDQYIASLNQMSQGLEAVKDPDGAKASLGQLMQSAQRVEAVRAELAKLSLSKDNPQHAALLQQKGPQIQQASQRLHNEIARIRENRPVRRELRAVLRQLRESKPGDEQ